MSQARWGVLVGPSDENDDGDQDYENDVVATTAAGDALGVVARDEDPREPERSGKKWMMKEDGDKEDGDGDDDEIG